MRDVIFNSNVSLQKFKKYLHGLQLKLIRYTRDIEIRFNSILALLKQILIDYVIVLNHVKQQSTLDKDCLKYPERLAAYDRKVEAYERKVEALKAAEQNRNAAPRAGASVSSPQQHTAQLLAQSDSNAQANPPKKPVPPPLPRIMDIRNITEYFPNLLQMALIADYIELFDNHGKKTGGTKWIKCMTIEELDQLKITLTQWESQTLERPKSPLLSSVLSAITKNQVKCFCYVLGVKVKSVFVGYRHDGPIKQQEDRILSMSMKLIWKWIYRIL